MQMADVYPVTCFPEQVGLDTTFVLVPEYEFCAIDSVLAALQKGAATIVVERHIDVSAITVAYNAIIKKVDNAYKALADMSAKAYNYPAKKLALIAVSGRCGKTTTCRMLSHILSNIGIKNAVADKSSLFYAHELHAFLDACVSSNVKYVIIEVAETAFLHTVLHDIFFDALIVTNLYMQHEDSHAIAAYIHMQSQIFEHRFSYALTWVNGDDPWCKKTVMRFNDAYIYGFSEYATSFGMLQECSHGLDIALFYKGKEYRFSAPYLVETFHAYNMLGVISLLLSLGFKAHEIQDGLKTFENILPVLGRKEGIDSVQM